MYHYSLYSDNAPIMDHTNGKHYCEDSHTLILTPSVTAHYPVIHAAMMGTDILSKREEGRERKDNPGTERRHCRKAIRLGHSEIKTSSPPVLRFAFWLAI